MSPEGAGVRLNALLEQAGIEPLDQETSAKFEAYLSLILRWNARLNLTAVRTEDAIISRHLAESIACAKAIPADVRTLLDFGSGAGLPEIPIALCRPGIAVTLAESQNKKAAFLQQVIRTLGIPVKVHSGRAEEIRGVSDCIVLRAVDKMPKAVATATRLIAPGGWLALMTTTRDLSKLKMAAGHEYSWEDPKPLPGSSDRVVALARRRADALAKRSEPGLH